MTLARPAARRSTSPADAPYLVIHRLIEQPQAKRGKRSEIMGELTGKVALVTGASKGIGAAIARAFARAGAAVAVNYASNKADADRVVDEIVKAGGKAVAIRADVAKRADVQRLFVETEAKLGRPSILVNNAGVYRFGPLESLTEEDFHRHFDTNVLGAVLAIQEAVKAFDGAGGSVINLSTISSTNPSPNSLLYSASKSAIDTITRELALELAGKGIRVNAIAPGMTETEGFAAAGLSAESAKALGFTLPMGRLGKPEDIARVALFLASDQSAWVTGERISVSGGQR
jgi:3-oxoacyl-[acyl-carrier protein] reductase